MKTATTKARKLAGTVRELAGNLPLPPAHSGRTGRRILSGFLACLAGYAVFDLLAVNEACAQDSFTPGTMSAPTSQAIPRDVRAESHLADLFALTSLPPIRISSARLVMGEDPEQAVRWDVTEGRRNFTIVRMTDRNGQSRFSGYIGLQALNQVWFGRRPGVQKITALADQGRMSVPPDIPSMDGVTPEQLGFSVLLESDGNRGKRRTRTIRRVLQADVVAVNVNSEQFLLRCFVVEVLANEEITGHRTLSKVWYVPVLGLAVKGESILPRLQEWHFENILVRTEVMNEVRKLSLQ